MKAAHSTILEDSELLSRFVARVFRIYDTPSLIQLVAGDANYLLLTSAIVDVESGNDPAFRESLQAVCNKQGKEYARISEKLSPVASSLGLTVGTVSRLDYYAMLGVEPHATKKEIQKAYRKKAYEVHPDTGDSCAEGGQAFIKLHDAYQTLIDETLRAQYDRSRRHGGIWYEDITTPPINASSEKKRGDKTRHLYQLGGMVLILIAAAFILNALYQYYAVLDGFDGQSYHQTPKRKDIPSAGPQTVTRSQSGGLEHAGDNPTNKKAAYHKSTNHDVSARGISKPTGKDNHVPQEPQQRHKKPVPYDIEPQAFQEDTTTPDKRPATIPKKEKKMPDKPRKKEPSPSVKPADPPSEDTPSSSTAAPAHSTKKEESVAVGSSFFHDHGIPAGDTAPPASPVREKNSVMNPEVEQQEDLAFLESLSARRNGDDKQSTPIKQGDEDRKGSSPRKNGTGIDHSRLEVTAGRLKEFVHRYRKTYERKDIAQFCALFDPDATENGKPFRDEIPNYQRNFKRLQAVTLRITMYQVSIRDASDMITAKGTFSLRWRVKGGDWREKRGDISMGLIESGTSYLIKQLDYQYHPQKG